MPINADLTSLMPEARKVYSNRSIFSGPMPKDNIEAALNKLLDCGIDTIVDFRGDAPDVAKTLSANCDRFGMDYYKFPLDHIFEYPLKNFDNKNFVEGLKKFFNVMNRGNAYVGCKYGVHRTNMGLMYNFLLNPNAKNLPSILPWSEDYPMSGTIDMLVNIFKETFEKLTAEQRKAFNLLGSTADIYKKVFEQKLTQLCNKNISDDIIKKEILDNIAGKFLRSLPKV